MSVEWTTNADGVYEVSSAAHLLQVMNKGALGADINPPANYMASSYLQTADIDLANDHASVVPIGEHSDRFTGTYDGGLYQIQNWSYSGAASHAGLFGYAEGCTLRKLRLTGIWKNLGSNLHSGFICGWLDGSSSVFDVEGDFADGSAVGDNATNSSGGTLFGWMVSSNVQGATVRGSVHFATDTRGTRRGGIVGMSTDCGSHAFWRNLATFPNGITGGYVGGLAAEGVGFVLSNSQNLMIGDLYGTHAGGIVGYVDKTSLKSTTVDSTVNGMTGNITSTTGGAGGIFGETDAGFKDFYHDVIVTKVFNYMHGDITGASGAGGIIGTIGGQSPFVFSATKSIVAMQGTVDQSVRGSESLAPQIEVFVDTSFGLISTGNDYGSATMIVDSAFVYHPDFTNLPYFVLSGTGADGTIYNWDFVYANIGGNLPQYTHLSVHTSDVSAPYFTDFGLGDSNSVVYLTYANTDTNTLSHDPSLTIVQTTAATIVLTGAVLDGAGGDDTTTGLDGSTTKDQFLFGNVYDITEAGAQISDAANDLFTTGDAVAVNVKYQPMATTFVNRGGAVDVGGVSALLLPFDPTVADVQDATFTLSDATSVDVGFDQTSGDIVVDGTAYKHGDYFLMDGKKVTVFDV